MKANSEHVKKVIELAKSNASSGKGGPFAAMIVKGDEVISTATNEVLLRNDPTAHAEVQAIRSACEKLDNFQIDECDLYTSCEPCPMCLGAIYWARPKQVFYVATRQQAAKGGFDDEFIYQEINASDENRKIRFHKIDHNDAFAPFEVWMANESKTDY